MKKTLSVIIAICMLVSLMSGFALAVEEDGSFSVDFRTGDVSTMNSETRYPTYTENTKGEGWSVDGANSTLANGSTMSYFDTYTSIATWSATGNEYVTFDFTVPADGTYEVLAYAMHRTYGGYINYYLDGEFIGKFDCYAAKDDLTTPTSETLGTVKLTEGTHKLKLLAEKSSGANAMMLPVKVDFKKVITDDFNVDFRKGDTSTMTPTEGWNTPDAVPGATRYPNYLATSKGEGWSVDGANSTIADGSTGSCFETYSSFATWNTIDNRYITFDFNVSGAGAYDITAYGMHRPEGGYINYFIDGIYIGRFDCRADKADYANATSAKLRPLELSSGAHKLTLLASGSGGAHSAMLPVKVTFEKTDSLIAINAVTIESDKAELERNETANISGEISFANDVKIDLRAKKFNTGNAPLDGGNDESVKITYESSDKKVVTVSENGIIMAVGGGVANITATVEIGGTAVTSDAVSVSVKDNSVSSKVTFAADSEGELTLEIGGEIKNYTKLNPIQVERGTSVKVSAADLEGKRFIGWVRGSADYGRIVSVSAEYEFTATTHTMLTAVYSDVPNDEAVVEYYNENGQYLETRAISEGKPENNPTLVGYVFNDWWIAEETPLVLENVTAFTRAVAKFVKTEAKFSVTIPSNGVSGEVSGEYFYDDEITLTSANGEVYWLRDGKVVDFGETYTFNAWGNTEITVAASGYDNSPKIVMDDVVKNDAYMIEYDAGDKEIIEVGIIFGESDAITIAFCSEKMNSQRNSSHGQFTAQSDYSVAKGYLIYKDGAEYKVIYSE
ncbi:MAG: hypothetical protein E7473_05830 [Ruminococcaceae bacterium]|nr:hypothetical protein [Oscillospiraceae bacterium]